MVLKILGSGCKNCEKLYENTKEALVKLSLDAEIVKETDMMQIAKYGVMRTPALVIDEKVAVSGRVPTAAEIIKLIRK
jgi:small redox-active disulfide protein 2